MPSWKGQTDCRHYDGVKSITGKVCCGGTYREKIKLKCSVHRHIYADACRKKACSYYEKGDSK
jgi:hypothetical protein